MDPFKEPLKGTLIDPSKKSFKRDPYRSLKDALKRTLIAPFKEPLYRDPYRSL